MATAVRSLCFTLILASIWTTREVLPSHIPTTAKGDQGDSQERSQYQSRSSQPLLNRLSETSRVLPAASYSAADTADASEAPPHPFVDHGSCSSPPGASLFTPHWEGSGVHVASLAYTYDMTSFGELADEHPEAHRLVAACGNLFMSRNVAGFQPSHICALEVWGNSFEKLHPEIKCKLREYPPTGLRKFAFFLRIFHVAKKAETASKGVLSPFAWIIVRRVGREMQQQAQRGEDPNIGRALTEVLRTDKSLIEPFLDMVLLGKQREFSVCLRTPLFDTIPWTAPDRN